MLEGQRGSNLAMQTVQPSLSMFSRANVLVSSKAGPLLQIRPSAETAVNLASQHQRPRRPLVIDPSRTAKDLFRGQFIAVAVVLRRYEIDVGTQFLEELARDGIAGCGAGLGLLLASGHGNMRCRSLVSGSHSGNCAVDVVMEA